MDKGRTSGSDVSLDEPEFEFSTPSSSESDETDGARNVPLLRGDLEGETWIRSQGNIKQETESDNLCFRTGDGDRDRGTLNRMANVGCGVYVFEGRDGGQGVGN